MKIEFKKPAVKALNSMDRPTKERIKAAIEGLTKKPPEGDIKPMEGGKDGTMRLRVGNTEYYSDLRMTAVLKFCSYLI